MNSLHKKLFYLLFLFYAIFLSIAGCATVHETKPASQPPASKPSGHSIANINIEEAENSSVVKIVATEPFKYISYMLDKHRRLVLEIDGTGNALPERLISVKGDLLDHIAIDDSTKPGMVRVENVLKRPCDYDLKMDGAVLSITFTPKADRASSPEPRTAEKEKNEMVVDSLKAEVAVLKSRIFELEDRLGQWKKKMDSVGSSEIGFAPGILETIELWRQAWQDKDAERYGGFYAESFAQDGRDKKAWLLVKQEVLKKVKKISVSIKSLQVYMDENNASVKFLQYYQADDYKDRGIKTLSMIKANEGWKILSEKWDVLR